MLKGMMWAERFLEAGKKAHLPYRDNHVGPVRVQKPRIRVFYNYFTVYYFT